MTAAVAEKKTTKSKKEKALVIVESPAKSKTIKKILGDGYQIEASFGHVRNLPDNTLGFDVEHDFKPTYVIIPEKKNSADCFDVKIRSFVDAVKEGGEAPVPCSQILYNQAIIDGISRSAELGREIEIEIPEI